MGNSLHKNSSAASAENNEPTPAIVALTEADVEIIKRTWKIPSANPHDSAALIFSTFLEKYPHNQQKFPAFKDKPLSDIKNTVEFRAHASRIFNVFSSVIDGLDRDTEMMKGIKKIIAEVGKFHAKKKVTKKAHNEVRSVLVDILIEVCKLSDEEKAAWTKLLDIFFHVMFECIDGRSEQFL
uniref:Globin n=1 Tax=Polypedilum nubifer TaxID=54969 RepID=V5YM54_9DIPT|nr:globin [Polypedilum nubifer]